MTSAVLQRDMLMPRPPQGMGSGLMLAFGVHVLLVIALAFSVRWHASEPAGVEAELWASVPQIAAPRAVEPEPQPVAQPQPPPPPAVTKSEPDPQIAIEKARREEADRRTKEEAEKAAEKRRHDEESAQKRKKEDAEKLSKEQEQKRLAALETDRKKQIERMMAQAGATGEPTSTGTAQRSAGPSASYLGRVVARIKPHVRFPLSETGGPAEVTITVAPDGMILTRRLAKSSGSPAFDEAALNAVQETGTLPRDTDGTVPSSMTIVINRPGQ